MSSKHLVGGIVIGAALGAGGLWAVLTIDEVPADCGGVCGEGTVCTDGACVVAPVELTDEVIEDEPDDGGRKRGRGRRGKPGAGELAAGSGPPLDDDSRVPRFDPNADQSVSMSDGSGRLGDAQVDRELAKLDKQFQACVLAAADRVDDLGTGRVKLAFGVDGKGQVTGVNVTAPANLKAGGIVPCVRVAVHGHKFPAFDGPVMKVSSSFTVE